MSEITTVITFSLSHARKLTEAEFKNLVNNITEHIHEEQAADEGDWGFKAITNTHASASHIVDGQVVMEGPSADWGALWNSAALEEKIWRAVEGAA